MRRRLLFLCLLWVCLQTPAQWVEESLSGDPGSLDFIHGEGYEQWILQSLAGDALVGISPQGRLVPRLATAWRPGPGGRLVFTLRGDARFGDGRPVTAEDVTWTFQRLLTDPSASPTKRSILAGATVGIAAGRPWVRSSKPQARLLLELARVPIAQRERPDQGSGPFAFRRDADAWVFTRRDHFLKPQVTGVRFRWLPDPAGVHRALLKGWLTLGAPLAEQGGAPPGTHRRIQQPLHAQMLVWSAQPGLLRLLERWRRDAFPPHLLGDRAQPSRGLWPETLGFQPRAMGPTPPPAAKTFELLHAAGQPDQERILLALRERARKDGVELRLRSLESGLLDERLRQGDFELAVATAVFDPHPWAVLEFVEASGPMNFTRWSHPRREALLARLERPGDRAWEELHAAWAAAPNALPLLDLQSVVWVDRRLQVEPSPLGLYLHTPGAAGWRWR